jgi:hypothetical protein
MKLKLLLWCYFCFHLAIGHTQGTVTVSESTGTCFNNTVFTYHSTHATGRYNYRVFISGFGITLELGWSVTNSRWEIRNANNASAVFYTNTLTTSDPYPPANSWFNASCGTITRFDRSTY